MKRNRGGQADWWCPVHGHWRKCTVYIYCYSVHIFYSQKCLYVLIIISNFCYSIHTSSTVCLSLRHISYIMPPPRPSPQDPFFEDPTDNSTWFCRACLDADTPYSQRGFNFSRQKHQISESHRKAMITYQPLPQQIYG